MFPHAVPITDNDVRSCTGGNNLKLGQHSRPPMSSNVEYAYYGKEGQPLIWTNSSDNLPCALGVHSCEKPDVVSYDDVLLQWHWLSAPESQDKSRDGEENDRHGLKYRSSISGWRVCGQLPPCCTLSTGSKILHWRSRRKRS